MCVLCRPGGECRDRRRCTNKVLTSRRHVPFTSQFRVDLPLARPVPLSADFGPRRSAGTTGQGRIGACMWGFLQLLPNATYDGEATTFFSPSAPPSDSRQTRHQLLRQSGARVSPNSSSGSGNQGWHRCCRGERAGGRAGAWIRANGISGDREHNTVFGMSCPRSIACPSQLAAPHLEVCCSI